MDNNIWYKASKVVSGVVHPFLVPLYIVVMLLFGNAFYAMFTVGFRLYVVWVVVLYTILIPAMSMAILRKVGKMSDYELDVRGERYIPLAIVIVSYTLCAVTLARIPSADFVYKLMVAGACCASFCLAITAFWKISMHLTTAGAMVAFAAISTFVSGGQMYLLEASILASGLLASSRLYLGHHTPWQVFAGFMAGFVIMILVLIIL